MYGMKMVRMVSQSENEIITEPGTVIEDIQAVKKTKRKQKRWSWKLHEPPAVCVSFTFTQLKSSADSEFYVIN